MNQQEFKTLALNKMLENGLINGWTFKFNKRKSAAGVCNHGEKTLSFSWQVLQHLSDYEKVDTVLHEIAHALVPGGHTRAWRQKAIDIGGSGSRTVTERMPGHSYNWVGECVNEHLVYRNRLTKNMRLSSCSKCSSSYNTDYIFKWKKQ